MVPGVTGSGLVIWTQSPEFEDSVHFLGNLCIPLGPLRCRVWRCQESPQWGRWMYNPELRMDSTGILMMPSLGSLSPRLGAQVPGLGSLSPNSSSKFQVCLGLSFRFKPSPESWTLTVGSLFLLPDRPGGPHRAASSWRPPQPAQPHRAATQWHARRGA